MLTVFRSNRAETLAAILAAQLRLHPPAPFETVQVVVNTWPTSRWLGEQLAEGLGGIAANIRYPFPGSQLRRIVQTVLGEEGGAPDPWRAIDLVWPVLELLPHLVREPAAAPLRHWLERRDGGGHTLERAQWQLARSIADALDDYALYRPELLASWWAGEDDGSDWQALLVRWLRQRLTVSPFGLRVVEAIARLRDDPAPIAGLPGCLRLFGLSSLAPVQVGLLQAISGRLPVDLYLLTPCPDLWQRCSQRRAALSDAVALNQPLAGDWLVEAPGLEARFGRLGAEFQQLLEGTGACQLGSATERDGFVDPLALSALEEGRAEPFPLLLQLQRQLAEPETAQPLQRAAGDSSLEFHACPGRLRQVQIVRDRLLQLLHANPDLQPRDVLVMTPQVDLFAPLVASVFGDTEATGVALDWRLTDRSQQSQAGLGRSLLTLLQQAGERLTASSLETLLESGPLRQRFQLSPEEVAELHRVLQQVGFRWGIDGDARGGEASGSLSWAIDRLLLGLVLPDAPGLAPGETAPFAGHQGLELLGRWLHLLTRLRHWLRELRHPRRSPAWAETLQAAIEDLFADGGDQAWELPPLLAAIDDWQQVAGGCELPVAAPVVAAVLEERLAADAGRFGHRSGALTISALEPMRAIPHRVIVLMGLDAGCFPRRRQRPGFHQLEQQRRLGDPSAADQDRYVLLEALLSARDHLLVTWNCRDERKGEELWPAAPVSQWISWLEGKLGGKVNVPDLVVHHPANPLDRRNFLATAGRPPASCDRRLLQARRLLEQPLPPEAPRALAATPSPAAATAEREAEREAGTFADLRHWVIQPQACWLRSLGLQPNEWADATADLDPAELDER
ncbi:exodeoxyribonuclease V subunit gamma, partial [Aphanothece stagnina]